MKTLLLLLSVLVLFTFPISVSAANKPAPFNPIPDSICIDPGHGDSDIGAKNQDLLEKNVNLEVALKLRDKLIANGYTNVFMTRTIDVSLSNADRYNFCNDERAAILISIHHNGSVNPDTDYTSALYMKKADVALAQLVADKVSTGLSLPNNGISRFASGVLLKAKMPATISEGFFLTNTDEYNLLNSTTIDRRQEEAQALYNGIVNYFSSR